MIRFIYVKTDALYQANKANYTNDIVFVEEGVKFYAKGLQFNDFATAISNLKIFSKISDGTNTYSASNNNSTLTVKGSKHITATASSSGLTISDNIVLKQGSADGSITIGDGDVIPKNYTTLVGNVTTNTQNIATIQGEGEGSIKKAVNDAADTLASSVSYYYGLGKDYTDEQIATAVSSVYKVKGTKATYADLPTSGNVEGDVWNVTAAYGTTPAGTNWVWVADTSKTAGGYWDALGGTVDLSSYVNAVSGGAAVTNQVVSAVTKSNGTLTVSHRALTANDIPSLAISKITNLQTTLDAKVPTSRTINSKALTANITLAGSDIKVGGSGSYSTNTIADAFSIQDSAFDGKLTAAIVDLDVSAVGGTGKVITTISETDGKISATATDLKAANVAATPVTATSSMVAVTGSTVEAQIKSLATSVAAASGSAAAAVQSVKATGDSYISATPTTATTGVVTVTVGMKSTAIATDYTTFSGSTSLTTGASVVDYVNSLGKVDSVSASGDGGSLSLSASRTSNAVSITGSLEWVEVTA